MRLWIDEMESPVGLLRLVVVPAGGAVCSLEFAGRDKHRAAYLKAQFGAVELEQVDDPAGHVSRLRAYFDGDLDALDPIPVKAHGTPFQLEVWRALRKLRRGETTSYGALATAIGRPGASRAVGLANGRNPIAIVVPCHRVIGADGTLTGYGGGLDRKRWLLEHERARPGANGPLFAAASRERPARMA
jgi:methylated-DNA-[protein]-cysteine S-methyltransferase